jgi:hypothetical protein
MKKIFVFLFAALLVQSGWADTEVTITRADSKINAGFKERIYVDGRETLVLANGAAGKFIVSDGDHTIYAELYTLTTEKLTFNARGGAIQFVVTPYTTRNFVIESGSGNSPQITAAPARPTPARPAPVQAAPARNTSQPNAGGVEGSLILAAEKIMEKIDAKARIAIVYVTAEDPDVSEFIAGELEFIMVDQGLTLIDRSQLDRIRREQNLQMSGEIDDDQAVSIGKFAGASVIITGAVTGSGNLRRLRLRALDTQTAQVLSVASERY